MEIERLKLIEKTRTTEKGCKLLSQELHELRQAILGFLLVATFVFMVLFLATLRLP